MRLVFRLLAAPQPPGRAAAGLRSKLSSDAHEADLVRPLVTSQVGRQPEPPALAARSDGLDHPRLPSDLSG